MTITMYDKIRTLASNRGETVHTMCKATGVSDATISNLKSQRKGMSSKNLIKVAAYYGVEPAYLLLD